jgi:hypothetical protein
MGRNHEAQADGKPSSVRRLLGTVIPPTDRAAALGRN